MNVCSPISMNATALSPGSFSFSWSVSTDTANTTENSRVANYLNGLSDTSKVSIPVGYLLFKVNYTFTATILNSAKMPGSSHSISYLGLMCPINGGCVSPLYYSNGSCVSKCPASSRIVTGSDPTVGMIQSCVTGVDVSMSASTTKTPEKITIDFDQPILSLLNDPANQILITLAGYTITREDNYSISVTSDSNMKVTFNFSVRIPAGTEAQVSFYTSRLPTLYNALDLSNYHMKNVNCSVGLLEYYPFSEVEATIISAANSITTAGTAAINTVMAASQALNVGGTSFLLGAALAAAMIQMNRFLNVSYPPNLMVLYNNSLKEVISLALPINLINEESDLRDLSSSKNNPHLRILLDADDRAHINHNSNKINDGSKFALYGMSSYFIFSGISPLATIGLLLGILFLIRLLLRKSKFSAKIRRLLRKIEEFLGWNFILTIVISMNLKISLYIALNFAYPHLRTGLGVVSFICSLAAAILNLLLVRHLVRVIQQCQPKMKKQNGQASSPPLRVKRKLARSYKILIEDYKTDTIWQLLYVPLLLIRSIAVGVVIVLFKKFGFTAAFSLFLMSIAFVIYMIKHRPIKDKVNLAIQIVFDMIIMIVSLMILVLSIMDLRKMSYADARLNIGWAITIANYLIHGFGLLKVFSLIVKLIYKQILIKLRERKLKHSRASRTTALPPIPDIGLSNSSKIKEGASSHR